MTEEGRKPTRWWLWGCGCLALAMAGLTGFCAVAGVGIAGGVFGTILNSDVVRIAVDRARAHPAAVETLGEPITTGWYALGSLDVSPPSGKADLEIPVSGPKASGRLLIEATVETGEWRYLRLELVPAQGQRIDLLDAASPEQ